MFGFGGVKVVCLSFTVLVNGEAAGLTARFCAVMPGELFGGRVAVW